MMGVNFRGMIAPGGLNWYITEGSGKRREPTGGGKVKQRSGDALTKKGPPRQAGKPMELRGLRCKGAAGKKKSRASIRKRRTPAEEDAFPKLAKKDRFLTWQDGQKVGKKDCGERDPLYCRAWAKGVNWRVVADGRAP